MSAALLAGACAPHADTGTPTRSGVRQDDLRRSLSVLAADSLEGRATASPGAARAARFIAAELERFGVEPAFPPAPGGDSAYFQRVPLALADQPGGGSRLVLLATRAALDSVAPERRRADVNVVGVIPGSDPALRDEAVIVGAHYDHVGTGPPVEGDSVYNGADDDASGVATVLEVARALARGPRPRRTVVLLLTTGEELGMLGTRWYLQNPVVPLASTVADLQVEMVGRSDPEAGGEGRAWLTGYSRSSLGRMLAESGVPIVADPRPAQRFFQRSDNIVFACRGIPAHTLSSYGMHTDYHRPSDEVERIDFAHLARVAEAAARAVRLMADGPAPAWVDGGNPQNDTGVCGRW